MKIKKTLFLQANQMFINTGSACFTICEAGLPFKFRIIKFNQLAIALDQMFKYNL